MKIKIALFGFLFANTIMHPIYADPYTLNGEEDHLDNPSIIDKDSLDLEGDNEDNEDKSENLIKLGTSVTMGSAITYQDERFSTKNSCAAGVTFKADVPKAWCNKEAALNIAAGWDGKDFTIKGATVKIGKMTTIGHVATIFGYEKGASNLLISPSGTVCQFRDRYAFDWFRIGYAIESPLKVQVGLFDKNVPHPTVGDEDKQSANKLDKSTDKKRPFKIRNIIPAVGLDLGAVTDQLNISLVGLGRCTEYIHNTDCDNKKLPSAFFLTWGGYLGMQYEIVPKKLTTTGQVAYVHGLGDYLSGLSAIQKDDARKEMCAVYYVDKNRNDLLFIDAFGLGGAITYALTTKWKLSMKGSYLQTLKDSQNEDRPSVAFRSQWSGTKEIAYEVNKYFTISGAYSLGQESRVSDQENKGLANKLSGSIKFSL